MISLRSPLLTTAISKKKPTRNLIVSPIPPSIVVFDHLTLLLVFLTPSPPIREVVRAATPTTPSAGREVVLFIEVGLSGDEWLDMGPPHTQALLEGRFLLLRVFG